ncbi:sigma-54 dependent transcriptional regulator [Rhodobacteraceae bacterium XHP0102]|nr:sigma-54 dependent transcriptional regulator [Rhodobacteraceae bacterium XHP0102]
MSKTGQIYFVDDEEDLRVAAKQTLQLADLDVICFETGEAALAQIARDRFAILITDIRMSGMDGLTLMNRALEIDPEFPVILVTGHGDVELAVKSMQQGAYDFHEKPYDPKRLVESARRGLEKRRLTIENRALRREVGQRDPVEARLTGRAPVMVRLRESLRAIAATDADVLIEGATGTGKEVAARAIHRHSTRQNGPFVHINCAALPAALIESELFGHEAGAFAGAMRPRFGKFEHGRGGTVFLDEIDSLPLELQAKLLTAIQNRVITRLGSNEAIELDLRFIAASKVDLTEAAEDGRFRADLLYRLNVTRLSMPPLSERREDIPRLFADLVGQAAARYKITPPDIPGAVLDALAARDWPGNVRELRNAADRFALGLDLGIGVVAHDTPDQSLAGQMAKHERALIATALARNGGSLKATYEALGLSRKTLYEKMQRHGLDKDSFTE